MAKAIIFNATPYKLEFKGKWRISILTKDHASKEIVAFGNNWIDTIWYKLEFSVKNKDKPYVNDNHGTVPPGDTRAYLVFCDEKGGVCCSELKCGSHVSQFDIHKDYINAVKKLIKCIQNQIDKKIGDIKKLKKQLEEAKKAIGETEEAYKFITSEKDCSN